tara:strand:- start:150 stop:875 length:726 start_codon:yes stop_codon:yes gene_type:complete
MGLNLTKNYSINFGLPKRSKRLIKFIIIHYTGMRKQSKAIERLCDQKSKVSSHYFIKNNGEILTLVPDFYIAWHAGKSKWKRFKSLNKYSIGIEINNPGHDNKYKSFTRNQILSTQKLIKLLIKKYKINYKNVLGHSDIAPTRKKDPGEKFPWNKLAKKKLCLWHTLDTKKIRINRKKSLNASQEKKFLRTLYNIGYSKINESRKNKTVLIKAFQRRFRQSLVNGYADKECYLIGKNLLNS